MKRALIIGASGFIGTYLQEACIERGWNALGTYYSNPLNGLNHLDITNEEQVNQLFTSFTPEIVFLPAANPNVEYCEIAPRETRKVNVDGTEIVAQQSQAINAKLVYFSSDYVFNGKNGPYREIDPPNPISEYGRQKLLSERLIQKLVTDHLIVRITVVYGWERNGKNFIERLIRNLQNGQTVKVPKDQIGSPTLVNNLVDAVMELVEQDAIGVYHVAGRDLIDRFSFALKSAKIFGLDASLVQGVTTSGLKQKAPRPLNAGMICDEVQKAISTKLMGVEEGLIWLKQHPKTWKD